jgi:hypothetical protein
MAVVGFIMYSLGLIGVGGWINHFWERRNTRGASSASANSAIYAAALRVYNQYRKERFSPYSQPPSFYNWLRQRLPSDKSNINGSAKKENTRCPNCGQIAPTYSTGEACVACHCLR